MHLEITEKLHKSTDLQVPVANAAASKSIELGLRHDGRVVDEHVTVNTKSVRLVDFAQ